MAHFLPMAIILRQSSLKHALVLIFMNYCHSILFSVSNSNVGVSFICHIPKSKHTPTFLRSPIESSLITSLTKHDSPDYKSNIANTCELGQQIAS